MSASREIELKFEVRPDDLPALARHALLETVAGEEQRQTSIYFDTADRRLRDAGMMLRVRECGGHYVQTVKANGLANGGLFDRGEWEKTVAANIPDLDAVKDTPLASKLGRKLVRAMIEPVFETVVDRSRWHIADSDVEIELVVDRGEVVAQAASAPISEIELELISGSLARLFDVAREINGSVPLRVGVLSKSERGYRLLDGDRRGIAKAEPIALSSGETAAQGLQAIAFACIRHFRLNEPLFTEDREGSALHQMRVALRRLRSAMSLFAPVIAGAETEAIATELRWISGLLGAARDLDVFVQRRIGPGETSPELWSQLLGQREAAFDAAIAALDSEQFRMLMISLVQWAATGDWLDAEGDASAGREQPLDDFAAAALDRLWRKLRKRGRHLADLEDEERHRARIAGKKLRYASEFFASLYTGKRSRKRYGAFVSALEDLQEQLGGLNDIVTAGWLSAEIAGRIGRADARQELLAIAAGDTAPDRGKLLAAGEAAYDALVATGPFWR